MRLRFQAARATGVRSPSSLASALALALLTPLPAAGECVLLSVEARESERGVRVRIAIAGDLASHRAAVAERRIELNFPDCRPHSALKTPPGPAGLLRAVRLVRPAADNPPTTRLIVDLAEPFEYALSARAGGLELELWAAPAPAGGAPSGLVRVDEPLPAEVIASAAPADDAVPSAALELTARIEGWAETWSATRSEDHLAFYGAGFRPPAGLDRAAWEAERRRRLASPATGEAAVEGLTLSFAPDGRASVDFELDERAIVMQVWALEEGSWRIAEELATFRDKPPSPASSPAGRPATAASSEPSAAPPPVASDRVVALVAGARESVTRSPRYDRSYHVLDYPGGDPGREVGTGADLVIRAYRRLGVDLQRRVHEDVVAAAAAYGIEQPDTNVDHRRIRNLLTFFRRQGRELPVGRGADWQPGDVVFWARDGGGPNYLGIVSDRRAGDGTPLVIHHPPDERPVEENVLFAWPVRAHLRWLPR